jgi:(1->4)-alpha-D-glucan 1-alpha-D-glucosylmutase
LVVVPRFTSRVGFPPVGEAWNDTQLELNTGGRWRDIFTGDVHDLDASPRIATLLRTFPAAVLEG